MPTCEDLIDFGQLPICHHFLSAEESEGRHPAKLGMCRRCGLVQMLTPAQPAELVPRFDWITYNEPEAHLDSMVSMLFSLPGVTTASRIAGLTYKEDSTLRRCRERGAIHVWRPDPAGDLGLTGARLGIESLQAAIGPTSLELLRRGFRNPQLLIVRHVLEHTIDPHAFMETLKNWLAPKGYLVFEIPDYQRAFDLFDYTTIWEDHTLYFTASTFLSTLGQCGLQIVRFQTFSSPYENCLVAVTTRASATSSEISAVQVDLEFQRGQRFAQSLAMTRRRVRQELENWRRNGNVAIFGAGHQSVMFINLLEIADLIDLVIDDPTQKCGRKMPGSRLPICSSSELYSGNVVCCLSSLGYQSEQRILHKHASYVQNDGTFVSIFPTRPDEPLHIVADRNRPARHL